MLGSSLAVAPQVRAQSTSANVYVQVQGQAGAVYGYNASSSGQLTAIPGSPFKPGTAIVGGTPSRFYTLGRTLIHSWGVASDGAIGSQLSQIPIYNYAGSSCGGTSTMPGANGALLDHTGKYIYVMLAPNNCVAYQSYAINSDGSFTFDGDTEEPQSLFGSDLESVRFGLPSVLGNETYAYAEYPNENNSGYQKLIGFRRESSGMLQVMQFSETDPGPTSFVHDPDASPTGNYVVAQLNNSGTSPTYLASYTVDSQGNLSTTNTFSNMPTTTLIPAENTLSSQYEHPSNSAFSPAGNLIAVYGGAGSQGDTSNGIEIYHFNGANPLTLYRSLLTGTPIDQVAWDGSNHLYAISNAQNKLWVFTVTSTSVTQDASYSIGAPFSMVVVSKSASTCSAPTSNGINVCSPAEGATVSSPVQVNAAATVSGGVYRFELWSGSTKLLSEDNGTMDQTVTLAAGSYKLVFDARNSTGTHVYATRDITVK